MSLTLTFKVIQHAVLHKSKYDIICIDCCVTIFNLGFKLLKKLKNGIVKYDLKIPTKEALGIDEKSDYKPNIGDSFYHFCSYLLS